MTAAAIIAAVLPTLITAGIAAVTARTRYQRGYDHGWDIGRADGYGQAEMQYDDLRGECYDLEQRLNACAAAVRQLPGGAA